LLIAEIKNDLYIFRVPLMVEVLHRDKQQSRDIMIGIAKLPMEQIITADKNRVSVGIFFRSLWLQLFHSYG
jgi:hypothetical protein